MPVESYCPHPCQFDPKIVFCIEINAFTYDEAYVAFCYVMSRAALVLHAAVDHKVAWVEYALMLLLVRCIDAALAPFHRSKKTFMNKSAVPTIWLGTTSQQQINLRPV